MGWRDLLQAKDEQVVLPWVGGRSLCSGQRVWDLKGKLPQEHGWYTFRISARTATLGDDYDKEMANRPYETPPGPLFYTQTGYLVGDRFVSDTARVDPDPTKVIASTEAVHLIEMGLDRFVRVRVGRSFENGPLIFEGQEMPLGPEGDVLQAFLDDKESVSEVKGVSPALDAAFRMESWQRVEAIRRRAELEKLRKEEEERCLREERRQNLITQLGDSVGRRALAQEDFPEAARAALAMGGAEYLDSRQSANKNEMVVRYRVNRRRFECTCDKRTLRIIDAGICLTDHDTGEKGDTRFTLESLPSVVQEADRDGVLVVFRHVN